jgi:rhamnopyranosyl-N-acetylglucosaminyl-diphospho-decaprenol beta-1,3/1,4-galactofuranosyltransferase
MSTISIAAVVVTFNRKKNLLECLNGLINQVRPLETIIIVDNSSTDGTEEELYKHNYINKIPTKKQNKIFKIETILKNESQKEIENINILYIRLPLNEGGAGGFYEGIKLGFELAFDWLWLMDDDGIPEKKALEQLLLFSRGAHFINSLVLDIEGKTELSFGLKGNNSENNLKSINDAIQNSSEGLIFNQANPFNGTLISKKLISKIGFPKKEFFIWGDEVEYQLRAEKFNMGIATVVSALHYHPKAITKQYKVPFIKKGISWSGNPLKDYCCIRNTAYIHKKFYPKSVILTFIKYAFFFFSKGDYKSVLFCFRATWDGVFEKWGKERKYLS